MSAIAAANLSDGRTQVWLIDADRIMSRWKETTDPNSGWTDWSPFPSPSGVTPAAISGAPLEDGRVQLYLIDAGGGTWSAWKTTTSSSASWTAWTKF
jgi:Tol biopolymer transport system component